MELNFNVHGPSAAAQEQPKKHKTYWDARKAKLKKQQDDPEQTSKIFEGCTVYFNGFMGELSQLHLGKMVLSNGGNVTPHLQLRTVTHMVCTRLSGKKIDESLKKGKSSLRIVKPDWLIDSIKAGRRLKESEYLVVQNEVQPKLLFKSKAEKSSQISSLDQPTNE
eukprot:Colp12_sorted_trinity150504_noHs@14071